MRIGLRVINDISSATAINGYWLFYVPSLFFFCTFSVRNMPSICTRAVMCGMALAKKWHVMGLELMNRVCHGELVRLVCGMRRACHGERIPMSMSECVAREVSKKCVRRSRDEKFIQASIPRVLSLG